MATRPRVRYSAYGWDGGGHATRSPSRERPNPKPFITLRTVREILQKKLFRKRLTGAVRLVGIIFGRPSVELFEKQISPNLAYWHHRSADHVDFFCIGFGRGRGFSPQAFTGAVRHFESETDWRYSGGTDLILLNARLPIGRGRVELEYDRTVVLRLEEAVRIGAVKNISVFFEQIIAFARSTPGDDPAWGFSNQMGKRVGGSALKRLLLSLLPRGLNAEAEQAFMFAVKDIGAARRKR